MADKNNSPGTHLGILVGGGPAPGINGVISAITLEARTRARKVIGILDGFQWLMQGDGNHVRELDHADVSRVHFQGGSILNTSRANPTKKPDDLRRVVETLDRLGIGHLATIGGDDTMFAASQVAKEARGRIRVCHVPKTIDNDLPLPGATPTFGFETARQLGSDLVQNLMEDSRTTGRWYFVVVMGRSVGHLALGIGKSTGANSWKSLVQLRATRSLRVTLITLQPGLVAGAVAWVAGSCLTSAPKRSVMSRPMMTSALAISSRFLPVRFNEWVLGKFKRAPQSITGIDKRSASATRLSTASLFRPT